MNHISEQYYIRAIDDGVVKYLFNTQVLLSDWALAKPFSSILLAKRYFKRTCFTDLPHTVVLCEEQPPAPKRPSLGSLVE